MRFRCHTGHAYSAETLDLNMKASTEEALYRALRRLHERLALLETMHVHEQRARHTEDLAGEIQRVKTRIEAMSQYARSATSWPAVAQEP